MSLLAMTTLDDGDAILQQIATSNAVVEDYVKKSAQQLAERDELIRQFSRRNDEYKIENELLQTRLVEALNSKNVSLDGDTSSALRPPKYEQSPMSVSPRRRTTVPLRDYQNLVQKYSNDIKAHEISREKLVEKAHKLKETCKNWQTWGDRIQHKLNLKNNTIKELQDENFGLRKALRERTADNSSAPSTAHTSSGVPTPVGYHLRASSFESEHPVLRDTNNEGGAAITEGRAEIIQHDPSILVAGSPTTEHVSQEIAPVSDEQRAEEKEPTSSQTTATLDMGLFPPNSNKGKLPTADDDDEPIFVSEQSTGKRKRGDSRTKSSVPTAARYVQNGSLDQPVEVKQERYISPTQSPTKPAFTRTETLDLDEIGDRIDTPRKRRRIQLLQHKSSLRSAAMEDTREQRSTSLPSEIQRELSDQRLVLPSDNENINPLLVPSMQRVNSDPLLNLDNDDNRTFGASYSFVVKDEPRDEATPSRHQHRPLQAMGTNQRILPRTSDLKARRKGGKDPERGAKALHTVAEDGNSLWSETRRKSPESRKRADKRLEELLEQTMPARQVLGPVSTPRRLSKSKLPKVSTPAAKGTPPTKNTPVTGMLPTPVSTDLKAKPAFTVQQTTVTPKIQTPRYVKPLRTRAVTGLRLDDFKPNLKKYPGMDASMAEPSRGREARRHMAGCTDSNCVMCGDQLRQLAADLPITAPTSLFASTQDDELTEDEKLIKHYLGEGFIKEQVAWMSKIDRERLVMRAKEQIVAERYSKHRVKPNQRGKSPPGFWDIEMASTQALEKQREEADRMEKAEIAERHREAMKGGGRWLFRDE